MSYMIRLYIKVAKRMPKKTTILPRVESRKLLSMPVS